MKTSETTLHTYGRHSSLEEYRDVLAKLRAFKTGGALYGMAAEGGQDAWALGLPAQWREALESDTSVSYVVYSYTTPIAWYSEIQCGWVIPDVRYSATTTVHQNLIRAAVS